MDIKKIKSLRKFLIITVCLSRNYNYRINLPHVEGDCEKLQRVLIIHKIRSFFYTENILRKLLCIPKDRVATEKNSIVYEIDCTAKYSVLQCA